MIQRPIITTVFDPMERTHTLRVYVEDEGNNMPTWIVVWNKPDGAKEDQSFGTLVDALTHALHLTNRISTTKLDQGLVIEIANQFAHAAEAMLETWNTYENIKDLIIKATPDIDHAELGDYPLAEFAMRIIDHDISDSACKDAAIKLITQMQGL